MSVGGGDARLGKGSSVDLLGRSGYGIVNRLGFVKQRCSAHHNGAAQFYSTQNIHPWVAPWQGCLLTPHTGET